MSNVIKEILQIFGIGIEAGIQSGIDQAETKNAIIEMLKESLGIKIIIAIGIIAFIAGKFK